MTKEKGWINFVQSIAILLTAIAALSGVVLGVLSIKRQEVLQKELTATQMKPILKIEIVTSSSENRIVLCNIGLGPAVITNIEFSRDGKKLGYSNLVGKITFRTLAGYFNSWESAKSFDSEKSYLEAGERINLIEVSAGYLSKKGFTAAEIDSLLYAWVKQMVGLTIKITYEDVFGNRQPNLEDTIY